MLVYPNRPKSLTEMLDQAIGCYPDKEALVDNDLHLTYKEFACQVGLLACNPRHVWQAHKGDRDALVLGNIIEFPIILFALAQIGAVAVPLNVSLKREAFKFMLRGSGAKTLILEEAFGEELKGIEKVCLGDGVVDNFFLYGVL